MVNTFLPYPSFEKSAQALDRSRLGKQRVEAVQILRANLGLSEGWKNHPAAVMWKGHEYALAIYGMTVCEEWIERGYVDNLLPEFSKVVDVLRDSVSPFGPVIIPWWVGNEDFHRSHRSNLKRKDSSYYTWDEPDDLPYLWPTEGKKFRTVPTQTNLRSVAHV
jgi:hypothetical protein